MKAVVVTDVLLARSRRVSEQSLKCLANYGRLVTALSKAGIVLGKFY